MSAFFGTKSLPKIPFRRDFEQASRTRNKKSMTHDNVLPSRVVLHAVLCYTCASASSYRVGKPFKSSDTVRLLLSLASSPLFRFRLTPFFFSSHQGSALFDLA